MERVVEQKALDVALARLSRLREEMARNTDPPLVSPAPTQHGVIQVTDPSAEIRQLRARLAEVELERGFSEEASPFLSVLASDIPPAIQSISVLGHKGGQRISFDADDDRPGKFFGCIEPVQSIGTVNVTVPDEHKNLRWFPRHSRAPGLKRLYRTSHGLRGEAANPGHPTGGVGHKDWPCHCHGLGIATPSPLTSGMWPTERTISSFQ